VEDAVTRMTSDLADAQREYDEAVREINTATVTMKEKDLPRLRERVASDGVGDVGGIGGCAQRRLSSGLTSELCAAVRSFEKDVLRSAGAWDAEKKAKLAAGPEERAQRRLWTDFARDTSVAEANLESVLKKVAKE